MVEQIVRVCIVYPADPLGTIPGGIDTFIRGLLRWAPDSIRMSLVGVTTDERERPVGSWSNCLIGDRAFRFFPVLALKNPERQSRIPLSARFSAKLFRSGKRLTEGADILEFHRLEPSLLFAGDKRPKTTVIHQNMKALLDPHADIRWRYAPRLYFLLERLLLPRFQSVYCVREDAVLAYKERYPALAERFHFTPTWVDPEIFRPLEQRARAAAKEVVAKELGFEPRDRILMTVGRLDSQKDPLLLLDAFQGLPHRHQAATKLVLIGDGVLRDPLERRIADLGLQARVKLAGLRAPSQIARYLQIADVFVLSSRYEGMPMSVLEALGTGVPVACTNVGEVGRVVQPGLNGSIASAHDASALAAAITDCLDHIAAYQGPPCVSAVKGFSAKAVLAPIYRNYQSIAFGAAR